MAVPSCRLVLARSDIRLADGNAPDVDGDGGKGLVRDPVGVVAGARGDG
jgi:hypothetical protein